MSQNCALVLSVEHEAPAAGRSLPRVPLSVLYAAASSDNPVMVAAIQSEPATSEPNRAGQLLTGGADPTEFETLPEPGVTDAGDEMWIPFVAPQPTPTPRSTLGLGKFISLASWRRNRAAAELEARRAEEAEAAGRAQLAAAEAR